MKLFVCFALQVKVVLDKLYENKKIASATHNIYAYRSATSDMRDVMSAPVGLFVLLSLVENNTAVYKQETGCLAFNVI